MGFSPFIGKGETSFKVEDAGFIPIYATSTYSFLDSVFVGLNVEYAIGLVPRHNKSGLFYQPKMGYRTDEFDLFVGYKYIAVNQNK